MPAGHVGVGSLGSAGQSPTSPLSSSSSLPSPGKMPSFSATDSQANRAGIAATQTHTAPSHLQPQGPASEHCVWNPFFSGLQEPGPHTPGARCTPPPAKARPGLPGLDKEGCPQGGGRNGGLGRSTAVVIFSEDSDEEEEEEEPSSFMGVLDHRGTAPATAQRTAVRRTMSDCSHLSVPSSLDLPDAYPGKPILPGDKPSPMTTGTRPPHAAVRRSLTVADDRGTGHGAMTLMSPLGRSPPRAPASPPPRRHDGSSEASILLPVPLSGAAFNGFRLPSNIEGR